MNACGWSPGSRGHSKHHAHTVQVEVSCHFAQESNSCTAEFWDKPSSPILAEVLPKNDKLDKTSKPQMNGLQYNVTFWQKGIGIHQRIDSYICVVGYFGKKSSGFGSQILRCKDVPPCETDCFAVENRPFLPQK